MIHGAATLASFSQLEAHATGPSLAAHVARERALSAAFGGRSVFGLEAESREGAGAHGRKSC